MPSVRAVTPFEFAFESGFAFIATIINSIILTKEYRKRNSPEAILYISYWTKITSFSCIIFGFLYSLVSTVATLKLFCYIGKPSQIMFISVQAILMGFNQLSRLHYCFSENSVHSAKGYPKWLFVSMISIGSMILIVVLVYPWLWTNELCTQNGNNEKYQWISPDARDAPNFGL